jgi:hypothetical protein
MSFLHTRMKAIKKFLGKVLKKYSAFNLILALEPDPENRSTLRGWR